MKLPIIILIVTVLASINVFAEVVTDGNVTADFTIKPSMTVGTVTVIFNPTAFNSSKGWLPGWIFNVTCEAQVTELCDGCRYQDLNVTGIQVYCLGPTSPKSCEVAINDFVPENIENCSDFDLLLEVGQNDLVLNITTANNTIDSRTFVVWAKDYESTTFAGMLPALSVGIGGVVALVMAGVMGSALMFIVSGVLFLVLAYQIIAFSMLAASLSLLFAVGVFIRAMVVRR